MPPQAGHPQVEQDQVDPLPRSFITASASSPVAAVEDVAGVGVLIGRRYFWDDEIRRDQLVGEQPLQRLGQPSDIGFAAAYLAS